MTSTTSPSDPSKNEWTSHFLYILSGGRRLLKWPAAALTCSSSAGPPSCGWSLRRAVTRGSACCPGTPPSRCSGPGPSWANAAGRRVCLQWRLCGEEGGRWTKALRIQVRIYHIVIHIFPFKKNTVFHQRMSDSDFGQEHLSALLPAWKVELPLTMTAHVNGFVFLNDLTSTFFGAFLCHLCPTVVDYFVP